MTLKRVTHLIQGTRVTLSDPNWPYWHAHNHPPKIIVGSVQRLAPTFSFHPSPRLILAHLPEETFVKVENRLRTAASLSPDSSANICDSLQDIVCQGCKPQWPPLCISIPFCWNLLNRVQAPRLYECFPPHSQFYWLFLFRTAHWAMFEFGARATHSLYLLLFTGGFTSASQFLPQKIHLRWCVILRLFKRAPLCE